MATKKGLLGKTGRILGMIPNMTETINATIETSGPLIDKAMEHHYETKRNLIAVPNVIDMQVSDAKNYLESLGISVSTLLEKPNRKLRMKSAGEVVNMNPKSGRVKVGSLIKIYYVDEMVIEESRDLLDLPNVKGTAVKAAQKILQTTGFKVELELLKAKKSYATLEAGIVIDMSPSPTLISKQAKRGTTVKIKYINDEVVMESKKLATEAEKRVKDRQQKISDFGNNAKNRLSGLAKRNKK